jgi:glycosyltransferase involved in cell wall biosynthesis
MLEKRTLPNGAYRSARKLLRSALPGFARRFMQPVVLKMHERRLSAQLNRASSAISPGPLIVSGFLTEAKGVSQGARLSLAGFRAAGFAAVAHDLREMLDGGIADRVSLPATRPGGVWFLHVNAPEAVHAFSALHLSEWQDRYRIGYWAFELPRVPDLWVRASAAFHEIWAPSTFVVDALRSSGVKVPVRLMPHPVALGTPISTPDRAAFGIAVDTFAVLALADLRSSAERKNLLGAIEIYIRAFPSPGLSRLIVKVRDDAAHPSFMRRARLAAQGRTDIEFFAGDLSTDEMQSLIASCSLLLSPHRAEGFGLPLAESLLAKVPVLATGWSGNVDFMRGMPELLIRYSLVPVRDLYGVYRARGQRWAEPDVNDAVAKLRALADSASLRSRLGGRGAATIAALSEPWKREALLAMPFAAWVGSARSRSAVSSVDAANPTR